MTNPADAAIDAVIYMFIRIVIPQLTFATIIQSHALCTVRIRTVLRSRLPSVAKHTQHVLRLGPYQLVIRSFFVVAEPAGSPRVTC